ncbi:hypothetical protein Poli38472_001502 [Pythium oligandrum]|uniref:Sas10 C-terminal domain-containing protein n=1 Tax=Pythium oligandrum TaxID=41045 RepID=A0A8K1FNF9_PYTOL|nr:hypothetical protein Poli38472_001502 [Pythium oligandrum]|eukprot:TMW69346.1 hypothetical protein Poli38472_001502 [Pythium oligandrum]
MGRKGRHTARTGDGGAELRLQKQRVKEAERAQKEAELEFYDDPSENDASDDAESDGSEFGNEEEVLQLGESEEEESDEQDGDDEEEDDEEVDEFGNEEEKKRIDKMDAKWGKSRKNFYSADTAEFELEDDEEVAKDEENAALELQRKQATMMDDEDFGLDEEEDDEEADEEDEEQAPVDDEDLLGDQLADISMLVDEGDSASMEQVRKDFSKMTKKDKLLIVNQTAPELLGLSAEMESTMKELKEVVTPAILKLKEVRRRTKAYNTGLQYLVTRQNLMLNYIANISFYLLLRAEGKSVTDHPVLQHLLSLKKQMNKLQEVDDAVNTQLHDLLTQEFPEEDEDDGLDKFFQQQRKRTNTQSSKRVAATEAAKPSKKAKKSYGVSQAEKDEAEQFYEAALREKEALDQAKKQFYSHEKPGLASSDEEDSDEDDGGKRGASFEIIKNKGLKAHKNKLNRNPRVKKRMQYRKAVIRRKGQVRDVRVGEAGRYGGESTGIKSNLTRSRKLRN